MHYKKEASDKPNFLTRSLKSELAFAVIVSFITSLIFYFILSALVSAVLDNTFGSDSYTTQRNKQLLAEFSSYVAENSIDSSDWYSLNRWVNNHDVELLRVYSNGTLIYDSDYSKTEGSLETASKDSSNNINLAETETISREATIVQFSDSSCDVLMEGTENLRCYHIANVFNILLPVILFIFIMLRFISVKIHYLKVLQEGILRMEDGDLETQFPVYGYDEMASLGSSLDRLRRSFTQKLNTITRLQQENREVITSMSHDMRTPMTPLIVYLQMLKDDTWTSEEQRQQCIAKSYEKALQLKNLSDNMFSYLLLDKDTPAEMTVNSMDEVFYDQLSGLIDYLGNNGFVIDADIQFEESYIQVNLSYIARIFDNLVSNIQKYADPSERISVKLYHEKDNIVLHMRNAINSLADYSQSTGFGVKNIRKMAAAMNVEFIESHNGGKYDTILIFKTVAAPAAEHDAPADSTHED